MQNDKEHLNVDLGFLDEAKPREAETIVKSTYKTNWRNIAIIGGLIVVAIIWAVSENTPSAPGTSSAPASSDQAPAENSSDAVRNGQFTCSRYDSDQADKLSPVGESDLTTEKQALEDRSNALGSLKAQINTSAVDQSSDQTAIDSYNAMIEQYNTQLEALKSDEAAYQAKVDQFNAQVQAHNDYLLAHCRSGG